MFETKSAPCSFNEAFYLKKKKLFHQTIRQQQRDSIICRLRQQAMIPIHYVQLINRLPTSISEIIDLIQKKSQGQAFQRMVANRLIVLIGKQTTCIFSLDVLTWIKQVVLLTFLIRTMPYQICPLFQPIFFSLKKEKQNEEIYELFMPLTSMVKKQNYFVLQLAKQLIGQMKPNRFHYQQLLFYNTLLQNCQQKALEMGFFNQQLLVRLSKHIEIEFYSVKQKIKMIQILIQRLYRSHQQTISNIFDLQQLYPSLEYYIGYSTQSKILTDRCLILIFNIIIDRGSQEFCRSSCWITLKNQIRSIDAPSQLKKLMSQVFLASIVNYPSQQLMNYCKRQKNNIFQIVEYLLQEFMYDDEMMTTVTNFLADLLFIGSEEKENQIKNQIISRPECFNSLKKIEHKFHLLDKWQLI